MRIAICAFLTLFLTACSGLKLQNFFGSLRLSGVVSAGPIRNTTVTAYKLNNDGTAGEAIATGLTDSKGKYTLNIIDPGQPVLIVAAGGTYEEEASGNTINLGNARIRTVLSEVQDGQEVGVTPVTEIATQNAIGILSSNLNVDVAAVVANSNSVVAAAMGLSDITLPPADPTQSASAASSDHARKYALVLAGISQLADDTAQNSSVDINSLDIMNALATAFKYNNSFVAQVNGMDIPVSNSAGASINLGNIFGGAANFNSAMDAALVSVRPRLPSGYDNPGEVHPPNFVTLPPIPVDARHVVLPPPPHAMPVPPRPIDDVPANPPPFNPIVWRHDLEGGLYYRAYDSAVNSMGQLVYVGLTFENNAGQGDAFVMKYNQNGEQQWKHVFGMLQATNINTGSDSARAVAIDNSDNIYVSGSIATGFNVSDMFVRKYDSDGNLIWSKQFGTGRDFIYGMTLDASGNIYLVGHTDGSLAGPKDTVFWDSFLIKLNNLGEVIWMKQIGASGQPDYLYSVKVDSNDNVFVAGCRGYDQNCQSYFARYSSEGTLVSQTDVDANAIMGLAFTTNGDVIVTGQDENYHGLVIRYDNSGNVIWRSIAAVQSRLFKVNVDQHDNLIVSGDANGLVHGYVAKVDGRSGKFIGSFILDKAPSQFFNAFSKNGFIYAAGDTLIKLLDFESL